MLKINLKKIIILIFLITSISFSIENLREIYKPEDLKKLKCDTFGFHLPDNSYDKYKCINIKDLLSENNDYTLEFYSKYGKLTLNTLDYEFQSDNKPVFIIEKCKIKPNIEIIINEKDLDKVEQITLDDKIEDTIDKEIFLSGRSNQLTLEDNSILFDTKESGLKIYNGVTKIIIYKHIN